MISKRSYRVLIGFDDADDPLVQNFSVTSHLTCIGGVK